MRALWPRRSRGRRRRPARGGTRRVLPEVAVVAAFAVDADVGTFAHAHRDRPVRRTVHGRPSTGASRRDAARALDDRRRVVTERFQRLARLGLGLAHQVRQAAAGHVLADRVDQRQRRARRSASSPRRGHGPPRARPWPRAPAPAARQEQRGSDDSGRDGIDEGYRAARPVSRANASDCARLRRSPAVRCTGFSRQVLDRGHAAEAIGQPLQQRQPVAAQRRVVGHHHHPVEERIDRRAQAREAAEHGDVVACVQQRRRCRRSPRRPRRPGAFGGFVAAPRRSSVGDRRLRPSCRMLRMRLFAAASASASGSLANSPIAFRRRSKSSSEVGRSRGDRVELLRRHALVGVIAAQALEDEVEARAMSSTLHRRVPRSRPPGIGCSSRLARSTRPRSTVAGRVPPSISVRARPSALRRSANGSLLPVGFRPAAKPPASVSRRSAIASTWPSATARSRRRRSAACRPRRSRGRPRRLASRPRRSSGRRCPAVPGIRRPCAIAGRPSPAPRRGARARVDADLRARWPRPAPPRARPCRRRVPSFSW